MKSRYLALPMVLAAVFSVAADERGAVSDQEVCYEGPQFYEYHNRIVVFAPLHQAYERIKPDAIYVGIEAWLVPVFSTGRGNHQSDGLLEAEFRMGYNYFYNHRDHVTPFLGVGVVKDSHHEKETWTIRQNGKTIHRTRKYQKPAVVYGAFGLLYDHEFNSVFNLGLHAKGMIGGGGKKKHADWGSPVGGIDISLPITFRFGYKRHWDIRLEPFYLYLHGSHISRNYFGGRSTVGYRF